MSDTISIQQYELLQNPRSSSPLTTPTLEHDLGKKANTGLVIPGKASDAAAIACCVSTPPMKGTFVSSSPVAGLFT